MAAHQQVLFTPLPNGARGGEFSLSVHIAPRLTNDGGDTTLDAFADWRDWPKTVAAITWGVAFGAGNSVPAAVTSAPPRSDLWTKLFGPKTPVRSHTFTPFDAVPVRSYPAENVAEFIRDRWTKVAATSPKEWPLLDDLRDPVLLGLLELEEPKLIDDAIQAELNANKAVTNGLPLASMASIQKDFVQLLRFHRPAAPSKPAFGRIDIDFHQALATLGQHPALLRLLGLVVDLRFRIEVAPPPSTTVRALPGSWVPNPTGPSLPAPGLAPVLSVPTKCLVSPTSFRAQPKGELVDGRLPFDDANRYAPIQFDVDGAAIKAVDLAQNLARIADAGSTASPERFALPSLRSAGLAVARRDKAAQLHNGQVVAATANDKVATPNAAPDAMAAEDLTRGYHVDVWDDAESRWFPLCARSGEYRFPGVKVAIPDGDEGFVSTAATSAPPGGPPDLRVTETVARWSGWSLVAPRPGGRLANPDGGGPEITFDPNTADPAFPLVIDVRPRERTLPRLRFGRRYRLRARAVDLAGNSVPINRAVPDPHASPLVTYGRFEPVPAPPVLPHAPRTEGESLERVVLRSNYNMPLPANTNVSRHIMPPKASQLLAEQHGMFDTPGPGSIVNPSSYAVIAPYPSLAPDPAALVVPAEQGTFETSKEGVEDQDDYRGTRYFPVDLVSLPYLPDPLARGAALRFLNLPGTDANAPVLAEFAPLGPGGWPGRRALRLVVGEGPESVNVAPQVLADGRVNVFLRKGAVVHVRLSAYLDLSLTPERLRQLGLWQWIEGAGVSADDVRKGQVWVITPYRTLTLVHAVRQPLKRAEFHEVGGDPQFDPVKALGDTFATFGGTLTYSRRSTSQIDVVAKWAEWTDLGPGAANPPTNPPAVLAEPRGAVAFAIPGDREPGAAGTDSVLVRSDRHEFGDTRHRLVTYSTVATSRFAEYFAERLVQIVKPEDKVTLPTGGMGVVPGSVEVKNKVTQAPPPDNTVQGAETYAEGVDYSVDDAAGTVQFASGLPQGGMEMVITYRVPPFTRPDVATGEVVKPVTVNILSSARPAAPELAYVIPTFAWGGGKDAATGTTTSTRAGNGLRVYLDRPWWSSGQGELLGVVLPPAEPVGKPLTASVTQVGVDPVFASGPIAPLLTAANFEGSAAQAVNLSLPGVGPKVNVVGYDVGFDAVRGLWYADIRFTGVSSYSPFVRLALARYQPDSVPDAHLSAVILADFAQLAPNRSATVSPGPRGTRVVSVVGTGYSKAGGNDLFTPFVQVTVERQVQGGDLGWEQVGGPVVLEELPPAPGGKHWRGTVAVPPQPAGTRSRLVIEEHERHVTTGAFNNFGVLETGPRLVYSDVIDL